MIIELKKFGSTLTSRDDGRGAFIAFKPSLNGIYNNEEIEINFAGVNTFSPGWGDEFVVNIIKNYKNKVILLNTKNKSVIATLDLLGDINGIEFNFRQS